MRGHGSNNCTIERKPLRFPYLLKYSSVIQSLGVNPDLKFAYILVGSYVLAQYPHCAWIRCKAI